ncbi:hypothetical protein [Paenibacillus sp. KN14-4R]
MKSRCLILQKFKTEEELIEAIHSYI